MINERYQVFVSPKQGPEYSVQIFDLDCAENDKSVVTDEVYSYLGENIPPDINFYYQNDMPNGHACSYVGYFDRDGGLHTGTPTVWEPDPNIRGQLKVIRAFPQTEG